MRSPPFTFARCVPPCLRPPGVQNSNERRVFNGIEFYLPQLAHMIIHLDGDLPSSALEQFALVVCQQRYEVGLLPVPLPVKSKSKY